MDLYTLFQQYPQVCTDTRKIVPDSIFFALRGENFNANAFAASALEQGCAYAVVDEKKYAVNERFILVKNTLKALQGLAKTHRKQWGKTVIGITGTNGKTTTKELTASVLSEKYRVLFTQGNLNNHIGVPLTLLQLTDNHDIAIIEMGASHVGEIAELCKIAAPDFGLITNVGKAHLEGFGSLEGVIHTKSELYERIAKDGKKIFINADNALLAQMAEMAGIGARQRIEYSLKNPRTSISGTIINCAPFLEIRCYTGPDRLTVKTSLTGNYNAENIVAAACVGNYFGLIAVQIRRGIRKYVPSNNRSQLLKTQQNTLLIDAYNANPSSMREAILNFASMQTSHSKTLILGDMLELGTYSAEEHQNIIHLLKENDLQNVFLVGKNFYATQNDFPKFETTDVFLSFLKKQPIENQYVLIKGSRGIKLEQTIEML